MTLGNDNRQQDTLLLPRYGVVAGNVYVLVAILFAYVFMKGVSLKK